MKAALLKHAAIASLVFAIVLVFNACSNDDGNENNLQGTNSSSDETEPSSSSSSDVSSSSEISSSSEEPSVTVYWDGTVDTDWYDAEQTEFIITTAEQFAGLAKLVNESTSANNTDFSGKTVKLGVNIMLNDTTWEAVNINEWTPIGKNVYSYNYFQGIFDGNNKIVGGVYIYSENTYQGLFGYIGTSGEVKNLGIVASYIRTSRDIGGLAAYNMGNIDNCYFIGEVIGTSIYYNYMGGLVGNNVGKISNSHSAGTVTGASQYVGGLAGTSGREITNSYSTSRVTGEYYVGGLVGSVGGYQDVIKSYSTGDVTGKGTVGGLAGAIAGSIKDSYSTGKVTGTEKEIGGLVGYGVGGDISNSYSIGEVSGPEEETGGFVGANNGGNKITKCYYNTETSGQNKSVGKVYNSSNDTATGKTTAEMKQKETFADWDFLAIWAINSATNEGYPYIKTNAP